MLRAMDKLKNCKGAEVSEGRSWWICQKWFNVKNGIEKTDKTYVIQAMGATPVKAARNFLKVLPRRLKAQVNL